MTQHPLPTRGRRSPCHYPPPSEPAQGEPLGHWCSRITGGVRRIAARELLLYWWAYREGALAITDLQLIFALHEMAERRRAHGPRTNKAPHYAAAEAVRLVTGTRSPKPAQIARVARGLRRLATLRMARMEEGAIHFARDIEATAIPGEERFTGYLATMPNAARTVPVPRRIVRLLAKGLPRAAVGTLLALLIRGLFWHRGQFRYRMDGRVKAAWITRHFGLSLRAVKAARAALVKLGVIRVLPSCQWMLNRFGSHFLINADWLAAGQECASPESAPRLRESAPPFAPPCTKQVASSSLRDTKNRSLSPVGSQQESNTASPSLRNLQPKDLTVYSRVLALYDQAVKARLADPGEGGRLDFIALVERATTHGESAVRLFAWLLNRRRYDWIGDADEARARSWIRCHSEAARSARPAQPKWPLPSFTGGQGDMHGWQFGDEPDFVW